MTKRTLMVLSLAVSAVFLSACQSATAVSGDPGRKAEDAAKLLTPEEAQTIALNHANAADHTRVRTEYDVDDGVKLYEIEFYSDGWEYDYEIHANTGEIISSHKEKEHWDLPAKEEVPSTEPAATEPVAEEKLTAGAAEDIALGHAKLARDQVVLDRTEYDLEHGVPEYEIEFHADGWEYDYQIHANTGEILSSHKEQETPDRPAAAEPASTESKKITAAEAEDLALNHAGLSRADVRFERTEYDRDDGVPQYEVQFRFNGWEYDYEVHAETGKIMSAEKDWDD